MIEIDDADFVGTVTEFRTADGAHLTWRGDKQTLQATMMASELRFTMLMQNAAQATFITDLATATENRFRVAVYRNTVLDWCGMILPDIARREDMSYPYHFEVSASCGLAALKTVEFRPTTTTVYSATERLLDIIRTALQKIPHVSYYMSGLDPFLVTAINWYEINHDYVDDYDPIENTYLDTHWAAKADSEGKYTVKSCYDVLREICTVFGARLYLAEGFWQLQQAETYAYFADNYARSYDYTSDTAVAHTLPSTQTFRLISSRKPLSGGYYDFFAPLEKVSVNLDVDAKRNLLAGAVFSDTETAEFNAGIVFGDGQYSNLRLTGSIEVTIENVSLNAAYQGVIFQPIFGVRIYLGAKYFFRQVSVLGTMGQPLYGADPVWTSLVGDYDLAGFPRAPFPAGTIRTETIEIDLDPATDTLFESGELRVDIAFKSLETVGPTASPAGGTYTVRYKVKDLYASIIYNAKVTAGTPNPIGERQYWSAPITAGNNTATLDIPVTIGDPEALNMAGALRFNTGAEYVATTYWGARDEDRNKRLLSILARQTFRSQDTPTERYHGRIYAGLLLPIKPMVPFFDGGTVYLPISVTLDTAMDEVEGEWCELAYGASSIGGDLPGSGLYELTIPPVTGATTTLDATPTLALLANAAAVATNAATTLAAYMPGGAITSITVSNPLAANAWLAGDELTVYNPLTGENTVLTVTAPTTAGATIIAVTGTALSDFPETSYVVYSQGNLYLDGASGPGIHTLPSGINGQILKRIAGLWAGYSGTTTGHYLSWNGSEWISTAPSGIFLADGDKGDIVVTSSGTVWVIDANVVSNAKFRQSAGLAIVGRSANTTGDVADIIAGTDGFVLRRSGAVLGFGLIVAANITDAVITLAKIVDIATGSFLGRNTPGTGVSEVLSIATAKTMLGLTGTNSGDQTITLTSDVTGSGTGSFATTIAANAVGNTKLADMATQTFKGRTTAGTGDPEDLTVAQAKTLLGLTGTNTGDQTIALTGDVTGSGTGSFAATIAIDAVTYAKMQNVSAASRLLGRGSGAGSGDVQELTVGTGLALTGTVLSATATGTVTGSGAANQLAFWTNTSALSSDANISVDPTNDRIGIGVPFGSLAAILHLGAPASTTIQAFRANINASGNLVGDIWNVNNTANANTIWGIIVGGAAAGDPILQLTVSGIVNWSVGVDNSDKRSLKLKPQPSPSTNANQGISITPDTVSKVGINNDNPAHELDVAGRIQADGYLTNSTLPTFALGSGAGVASGGGVNTVVGGNNAWDITFTTGTTPVANGTILTVTPAVAAPGTGRNFLHFTAGNNAACNELAKFKSVAPNTTTATIVANGTLTANTTYQFICFLIQY